MPALHAFGRRWQIASDDFVFPGLIDLLIRVSWIIAGCIVFWHHQTNLDCIGGHLLKNYLYGNLAILLSIVIADIALVQNSMAGCITDLESRKYVKRCLYIRLIFVVPEVIWNAAGTVWVFHDQLHCDDAQVAVNLIRALIACNWVLVVGLIIAIIVVFDPISSSVYNFDHDGYERFQTNVWTRSHSVWERRCRLIMCSCLRNDELSRDAFKEVGKMMSFLLEDVDFVPSDIAAGLIMLHVKARMEAESNSAHNSLKDQSRERTPIVQEVASVDRLSFEESLSTSVDTRDRWNSSEYIYNFMRFSLGSYGWPWYVVANCRTGLWRLWENLVCCSCFLPHTNPIVGDNCCYCHTSALRDTLKIEMQDIIYASFGNGFYETPFYIAVDHYTKSVVIAIRGTMSLQDALTDLTAEAKPVDSQHIPPECKAHSGFIRAAQGVLSRLEESNLLIKVFQEFSHYELVITGHSLGGGTATVLSMMLKHQYPNIRCYAYSAPGCTVNIEGAKYCESFVTSVIVGDDIVPRLSVPVFDKFRKKLEVIIRRCRTPKYRILVGGCFYMLVGGAPAFIYADEDQQLTAADTNLLQSNQPSNYHTYVSLAEVSYRMQREAVTNSPMYPAGKIFYVTERPVFDSRPDLTEGPRFQYKWAKRSDFDDVRVTPKMLTDHYPDNVYNALKDLVENAQPTLLVT